MGQAALRCSNLVPLGRAEELYSQLGIVQPTSVERLIVLAARARRKFLQVLQVVAGEWAVRAEAEPALQEGVPVVQSELHVPRLGQRLLAGVHGPRRDPLL